ncbi:MAG TPA: tRNA pseudouridine(55) synthase TruB [Roseiflexaceae bacterium]|nr:tRNA pseudouridine(55) synthase TruB [Roseiflexaceae bacterium]
MHGFLNIDKPAGLTSHDVVAKIRRLAGQKRVGHAGTLDPAATGVLVVALGNATRLIEYVQDATSKRYLAVVRLGVTTSTDDAEGPVLDTRPVPALARAAVERALEPLRGEIAQVPPMYSALHHQGRRLHELAREGIVVDRAARLVTIERLDLLEYDLPLLTLDIMCSKGTYIRSLARDLGEALGCGAHLHALRRTAVGAFLVEDAVPLEALVGPSGDQETRRPEDQETRISKESPSLSPLLHVSLSQMLLPPEVAVADWPVATLSAEAARKVRNGLPLALDHIDGERARAHSPNGELLALLHRAGPLWKPEKVFDWS